MCDVQFFTYLIMWNIIYCLVLWHSIAHICSLTTYHIIVKLLKVIFTVHKMSCKPVLLHHLIIYFGLRHLIAAYSIVFNAIVCTLLYIYRQCHLTRTHNDNSSTIHCSSTDDVINMDISLQHRLLLRRYINDVIYIDTLQHRLLLRRYRAYIQCNLT